jgi:nicotinate-nucleotide pyrophosphorylase (carboxylating)
MSKRRSTSSPVKTSLRPPDPAALAAIVAAALAEDLAGGDPTSEGLFGPTDQADAVVLLKEPGVVCGLPVLVAVFAALDSSVVVSPLVAEGQRVEETPIEIARISGPARAILGGERTALNLVGRLSGIATLSAHYAAQLVGTGAVLLDTRKTTPGLRALEKYAVRVGGGTNHRRDLGEAILVKDNHLRLAGGIAAAAARLAATYPDMAIEVEAETQDEVSEALQSAGVSRILLDNMNLDELRSATALVAGYNARTSQSDGIGSRRVETEASGGITLANLREVGQTGVNFVSVGALTHSARSLDVSLEVVS